MFSRLNNVLVISRFVISVIFSNSCFKIPHKSVTQKCYLKRPCIEFGVV